MVEKVSGRTNSSACSDMITSTSAPACWRRLTSSTALYDAMPPQIPTTMRRFDNTANLLNPSQRGASPSHQVIATIAQNDTGSQASDQEVPFVLFLPGVVRGADENRLC